LNIAMQQLRIRHLQLLNIIHETGSLRRAASVLCVTQPAISAMLKDVEHAFGGPLAVRGSRGAELTTAGKALRLRLNVILEELGEAESVNAGQGSIVRLKVGAMRGTMFDLVPGAVSLLHSQNDKIDVKLTDGSIERVVTALLDDEIDCVVGRLDGLELDAEIRSALFEEELFPVPLGVACAPTHPLAAARHAPTSELVVADWILLPAISLGRIAFNLALIQQGYRAVLPVVESESLATNFHVVANSTLLTIAPRSAIALYRGMGVVEELAIDFPLAISPIAFICHRSKTELHGIQQFRSALRQAATALMAREAGNLSRDQAVLERLPATSGRVRQAKRDPLLAPFAQHATRFGD
jgi:DNA-binding transcriptional LysR family regulator